MNDSSENQTTIGQFYECMDRGNVVPVICQCTQVMRFLLGTPALVWCLWISLSGSPSGGLKPTQVLPINLFIVELVFCVEGLLEVMSDLLGQKTLLQGSNVFFYLAWVCRPLVQTCICVERYLAVAQPVTFLKYRLRRYRVGTSSLIWGLSFIYACFTIPILGYEEITEYVVVTVYCLGMVIISLCCFFILRVLKQPGPGEVEGGRGGDVNQGTTDLKKSDFRIVFNILVNVMVSSISVVIGYAAISSTCFDLFCNVLTTLLIVNMLSVVVSPLLLLHGDGRLPCRRGKAIC